MSEPTIHPCCTTHTTWTGTPVGHEGRLAGMDCYITTGTSSPSPTTSTESKPGPGILLISDLFGWRYPNLRLLADRIATRLREIGGSAEATVYLPDFFHGDTLSSTHIFHDAFDRLDLKGFLGKHSRSNREADVFAAARAIRQIHGPGNVGAVGYCYGGWAVLRLASADHAPRLIDAGVVGHPSMIVKEDFDHIATPLQLLAPEVDPAFHAELKMYAVSKLVGGEAPFEYVHFPGVVHSCFVRGDPAKKGEKEAMVRGMRKAVAFLAEWLGEKEDGNGKET